MLADGEGAANQLAMHVIVKLADLAGVAELVGLPSGRPTVIGQSMTNSWVWGLRWSSRRAPATARSLRFQTSSPRVMSDR